MLSTHSSDKAAPCTVSVVKRNNLCLLRGVFGFAFRDMVGMIHYTAFGLLTRGIMVTRMI
jgi:hypothetical protein